MVRGSGNPAPLAALLALTMATSSCKGGGRWGNAIAKAATVAAVNGAVAVANRSISGCYTSCGSRTVCNQETGLCVPQPECISNGLRGRGANCGKTPDYLDATKATEPAGAPDVVDESCAGFCLSSEKCVVFRGDLDCVAR